ncbi:MULTISPECIES: hypothetical protein [Corallococcus]|uniref:hypothetical protein n=1 Tax=Corallococcus TaxID=83461 RepID=UPI0011C44F7A|nr:MULTISPECIES: hypothetical protein [Corallococcus]
MLVAFILLLPAIFVMTLIVANIAMAVEMARAGVDPQDSEAIRAVTEQLWPMSWLHVAVIMTSSLLVMLAALLGGFLSPKPLKERLRLGTGTALPSWAWGAALVGCFTVGQALESLSVLAGVWNYAVALKSL